LNIYVYYLGIYKSEYTLNDADVNVDRGRGNNALKYHFNSSPM